jgi:hypothetical protein
MLRLQHCTPTEFSVIGGHSSVSELKKWPSIFFRVFRKSRISLMEMAARAGIEPCIRFLEACVAAISSESAKSGDALPSAQELASLTKIVVAWLKFSGMSRAAVVALTQSVNK